MNRNFFGGDHDDLKLGITDFVTGRNMFLNFFNPIWWIKRF